RGGRAGNTAARLHDLQQRRHRRGRKPGGEIFQITIDHRLHVGVERGDDGALVFAERRVDLARERNEYIGTARADHLARAALLRVVEERKQKPDRERLGAGRDQLVGGARKPSLVQRNQHLAVRPDTLGDLAAETPGREEGGRLRIERQVVHLV